MKQLLSFIIPAKNEAGSLPQLYTELTQQLNQLADTDYEILFIDDGSTDQTFAVMKDLHQQDHKVHALRLRGNFGKSTALQIGFDHAKGDLIFTLDADLQDNPKEIPAFLNKLEEGYDLVSGWKKNRHDPISKVIPSRILNYVTRKLTGVHLHDINCGYKAYRREVIENINIYGELYRFIPLFANAQKFKVTEIVVDHRAREHGKSKYGWERNIKGLLDLFTIVLLTGYNKRPGHFFGIIGLGSFSVGFLIGLYITYLRITTGGIQYRQPLLFLGILLMVIGIQLITTGLLAEMFIFSQQKPDLSHLIRETV